ncbi:MAG: hypothetical protein F4027_07090 [Rhodospirillaceae bacterium]|nr:hypothetical protein [Rhodospirillaceae bacterium]MYH38638.1 hypothetical protein [Rhodospirillaceae bacterium]MYK13930.1 hypothetical protein [Rhodospirillaceae bacterium]MYK58371.1 hypothetical protein [Rhodospirillaceae bacterium]
MNGLNAYGFLNAGFGRFLTRQTNQPHADAWRALSGTHPMLNKQGKESKSRLSSGWAIVRPDGATTQLRLAAEDVRAGDPRTRFEAFFDELESWDGGPRLFLTFDKPPLPLGNLFLTVDLRAVRICSPGGVETFDYTKPAGEDAGVVRRNIERLRAGP